MLFRFEDKSVHVYWDAPAPSPDKTDTANPTAPYTTDDYDATTRLRCGNQGRPVAEGCAAGILRMEDGVSIVVTSPGGEAFTINVMGNHVNASDGREVRAVLDGDTWIVNVDGRETYEIPLAAIDGG